MVHPKQFKVSERWRALPDAFRFSEGTLYACTLSWRMLKARTQHEAAAEAEVSTAVSRVQASSFDNLNKPRCFARPAGQT
jgi:hypothetical protein